LVLTTGNDVTKSLTGVVSQQETHKLRSVEQFRPTPVYCKDSPDASATWSIFPIGQVANSSPSSVGWGRGWWQVCAGSHPGREQGANGFQRCQSADCGAPSDSRRPAGATSTPSPT